MSEQKNQASPVEKKPLSEVSAEKHQYSLITKIIGVILAVIFLYYFGTAIYVAYNRFVLKKILWDGRFYTQEEMNKLLPQERNLDVPTRQTPEVTYQKFREALGRNDIEEMLSQVVIEKREKNRTSLIKYKNEHNGSLVDLLLYYPIEVRKDHQYGNLAGYKYDYTKDGEIFTNPLSFIKDSNGDWLIDL